jgi:hypothetical protein
LKSKKLFAATKVVLLCIAHEFSSIREEDNGGGGCHRGGGGCHSCFFLLPSLVGNEHTAMHGSYWYYRYYHYKYYQCHCIHYFFKFLILKCYHTNGLIL